MAAAWSANFFPICRISSLILGRMSPIEFSMSTFTWNETKKIVRQKNFFFAEPRLKSESAKIKRGHFANSPKIDFKSNVMKDLRSRNGKGSTSEAENAFK